MFRKREEEHEGCCDTMEQIFMCSGFWSLVLDDYDNCDNDQCYDDWYIIGGRPEPSSRWAQWRERRKQARTQRKKDRERNNSLVLFSGFSTTED
jgi:hypothetical protein